MFARIVEAGGGLDAFLSEHAVVLTSDHAQTAVEHALPLADALAEDWAVLQPNTDRPEEAEIAVSPTSRAGAVYILDTGRRHAGTHERARLRLRELAGVDLVTWLAREDGSPGPAHRRRAGRSRRRRGGRRARTDASSASAPAASCATCAATAGS